MIRWLAAAVILVLLAAGLYWATTSPWMPRGGHNYWSSTN